MKKIVPKSLGLLALGLAAAAAAGTASAAPVDIVAIGASNTEGIYVPRNQSYPAQLEAMLRQKGYDVRVRNAGVAGNTTADILRRVNSAVPRGTEIVIFAPPVGNDMAKTGTGSTDANIGATIERVKQRGANVAYLSLVRGGRAIARQYGLPYCEFPPQPELTSEGIHYTAEGYRRMARAAMPCVEQFLK